jgi:hypothetical protein
LGSLRGDGATVACAATDAAANEAWVGAAAGSRLLLGEDTRARMGDSGGSESEERARAASIKVLTRDRLASNFSICFPRDTCSRSQRPIWASGTRSSEPLAVLLALISAYPKLAHTTPPRLRQASHMGMSRFPRDTQHLEPPRDPRRRINFASGAPAGLWKPAISCAN